MLFPMVASVSDERDAIVVRIPTQIATARSKLPAPVPASVFTFTLGTREEFLHVPAALLPQKPLDASADGVV